MINKYLKDSINDINEYCRINLKLNNKKYREPIYNTYLSIIHYLFRVNYINIKE